MERSLTIEWPIANITKVGSIACLLARLLARWLACSLACLLARLLACLLACSLACSFACLVARLLGCSLDCSFCLFSTTINRHPMCNTYTGIQLYESQPWRGIQLYDFGVFVFLVFCIVKASIPRARCPKHTAFSTLRFGFRGPANEFAKRSLHFMYVF